jgi:hypothetical protein
MAAGDFTTVADVEAFAQIKPDTATDALIQMLITNASAFMTRYMNRNIFSAIYTENRSGSGGCQMSLSNIPITAVASVSINGSPVPPSADPRHVGFVFDNNLLYYRGGIFCKGLLNVVVVYTAGVATISGSPPVVSGIPADLAQVCIDLVTVKYKRRTKMEVQGETLAQQTITFVRGDLTPGAKLAMDQWRDMRTIE